MQTEISKMSDEELLKQYRVNYSLLHKQFGEEPGIVEINYKNSEQELLKRLSKNNIEEFKKKLIDEIYKLPTSFSDNGYDAVEIEEVENIINNIGKEK